CSSPSPPISTLFPYTTLFRSDMSVAEGIRKSLDNVRCLEAIATKKNIPIIEPFSGLCDSTNSLFVVGPSRDFYDSLLPDFRCTPDRKSTRLNSSHDQISYAVF